MALPIWWAFEEKQCDIQEDIDIGIFTSKFHCIMGILYIKKDKLRFYELVNKQTSFSTLDGQQTCFIRLKLRRKCDQLWVKL